MSKVYNYLFLLVFVCQSALGSTIEQKQKQCKQKLIEEFQTVLSRDNGLIQAQLMLTALKLSKKVLNRKNVKDKSIEAYVQDIVGRKTIERLNQRDDIQNDILTIYKKYSGPTQYFDAKADLEGLRNVEISRLSDAQIARYMIQIQTIWQEKDDFGFNEKDFSTAWFVNRVHKNANGIDSFFISNIVKEVLKDPQNAQRNISKNIARAHLDLKARLQKLKMDVFKKHKELCIDIYNSESNKLSQNASVFSSPTCKIDENKLLNKLFEESLEDILKHVETPAYIPEEVLLYSSKDKLPKKIRQIQDIVNSRLTNKEKIVQYYSNGMNPKEPKCDGFIIVDKKNFTTTLYSIHGEEIVTTPTILGQGRTNNFIGEQLVFNPDSRLRRFERGGKKVYTKTTGAGTYLVKKNLTSRQRSLRKYGEEFNDRVLVIYSPSNGNQDGKKEEILAVHGVPNEKWAGNRNTRMKSFEKATLNKRLSTGCVNLEAYAYDLMNEFLGHQCPIYILPEDESHYYHMENGQLKFSTGDKAKKLGKEKASDGKNINLYNFDPKNYEIQTSGYDKTTLTSKALDEVFNNLSLIKSKAPKLGEDDFQDIAALTHALNQDNLLPVELFLNLYNSFERYKAAASKEQLEKLEKSSMKIRKKIILRTYFQGNNQDISEIIKKSDEVNFVK